MQTANDRLRVFRARLVCVCCIALLAGRAVHAAPRLDADVIDRILAVVAGNLILQSDVNAAREFHLVAWKTTEPDPNREILQRLIDRGLILAEVERYAPTDPPAGQVTRQFDAVRAMYDSADAFSTALASVGFTEAHLRETVRQNLRVLAYLDQRFTVQPPSDDDLRRYYSEHPLAFTQDGQPIAFEQARARVVEAATADRRQRLVDDWVAGLRRRTEVVDLSSDAR